MAITPTAYSFITFGVTTPLTAPQQAGLFQIPTLEYIKTADIYVSYTRFSTGETTTVTSASPEPVEVYESNGVLTVDISLHLSNNNLGTLTAADSVRVGRTTEIDELTRTFSDGSVLKASDLNAQSNQLLFAIQEAIDTGSASLPIDIDNRYNAGGRALKNLGAPSNDKDAVTLEYVTALQLYNGAATPQSWFFTLDSSSNSGADRRLSLSNPTPATAVDNMYLVEVDGVMQRPGPNLDYVVEEANGLYTLVLIGASGLGTGGLPNDTRVTVRNFGTTRNVLVAPFKAGEVDEVSLEIERIANQTGDLISLKSEAGAVLTRIDSSGAILIGDPTGPTVNTTYISSSQIEIGDVALSDWTKYGIGLANANTKGRVDIQGRTPDPADIAFRITRGESNGSMFPVLSVNYGSEITVGSGNTGKITSPSIETVAFTCFGNSIYQGPLLIDSAQTLSIGTGELTLSRDAVSRVKKVSVDPWNNFASNDSEYGIQVPGVPGAIKMNTAGQTFIGFGGNGNNGIYGGPGSILFNHEGGSRYGPTLQVERANIFVRGYNIPNVTGNNQGGAAGQTGNDPAFINYAEQDARDTPLANLDEGDLVCKKQVVTGLPVSFGWWRVNTSVSCPDNVWVNVPINGNLVDYDPLAEFAYRSNGGASGTDHGVYVTAGTWIVRARGYAYFSAGAFNALNGAYVKLQVGTQSGAAVLHQNSVTIGAGSPYILEFDLSVRLLPGDPVLDIAYLSVKADTTGNPATVTFTSQFGQAGRYDLTIEKVAP